MFVCITGTTSTTGPAESHERSLQIQKKFEACFWKSIVQIFLLIFLLIWSCAVILCSTSPSQCFHIATCYHLSFSQVRISHAVTMNDEEDFLSPAGQRRKTLRSMTTSNLSLSPTRSFAPTTSPERGKLNRRSDPTLLSSRQSPRKSSKTIMEKVQKFLGLQLANCLIKALSLKHLVVLAGSLRYQFSHVRTR